MIVVRDDGKKTIIPLRKRQLKLGAEGPDLVAKATSEAPDNSVFAVDLEISPAVVRRALEAAKNRGFQVVLGPSPTDQLKEDYYELADVLTPKRSEAESLVGFEIKN